jgi:hypothetical protein
MRLGGLPTRERFDQDLISRPGPASRRSRTQAELKIGSAVSGNEVTAVCAACLLLALSPSSAGWLTALLARRFTKVATSALANK